MKKYDTVYSGHGSRFVSDGNLTFDKSLEECEKKALEWELGADTIGGRGWALTREEWEKYCESPY